MANLANRTIFNAAQLYMLEVMAHVQNETELNDIKNLLAKYYANKALDAIDKLWDEGKINEETLQTWKHEHMRTPYIHA